MTIKIAPPDHEHRVAFENLSPGQVFKFHGHGDYYMKIALAVVSGAYYNRVNLSTGHLSRTVDDSSFVIPVTLEAKEL